MIDRTEMELIMGQLNDETWKQILLDCDTNKDGKVIIIYNNTDIIKRVRRLVDKKKVVNRFHRDSYH
jgi:hypothetical protein